MVNKQISPKSRKRIHKAIVHIHAYYNNTILTVSDEYGDVFFWNSAGKSGFKGSKKSTPYASQVVASSAIEILTKFSVSEVEIRICGPGNGRDSALRGLLSEQHQSSWKILKIVDVTKIPHNGVRRRKKRRV